MSSINEEFVNDLLKDFNSQPKRLSSMYFYDAEGDLLFQKIMELDEYYLSRAEDEILHQQSGAIAQLIMENGIDEIMELGAGDGRKTRHLLRALLELNKDLTYHPMDISPDVLEQLRSSMLQEIPNLECQPIAGDYWQSIPSCADGKKRLMMFLGSNLGNYPREMEEKFFSLINEKLRSGDLLLMGLDLAKSPLRIFKAYHDAEGVTKQFNLNLLHRINRELQGNFNVDAFDQWEVYDPVEHEARSYIISKEDAEYSILNGKHAFSFYAWEAIHVETSRKYLLNSMGQMAKKYGFEQLNAFTDSAEDFVDVLWVKK